MTVKLHLKLTQYLHWIDKSPFFIKFGRSAANRFLVLMLKDKTLPHFSGRGQAVLNAASDGIYVPVNTDYYAAEEVMPLTE